MASPHGRTAPALAEELEREPFAFEFFQAVRLLRMWRGRVDGDAVRFATPISLEFPASELQSYEPATAPDQPARMVVNFMGLTGPSGVLPSHYTASLIERRIRHRDVSAQRFLDLFNHRLISLFYRAWEKHHFYVAHERHEPAGFQQYLLDLVGLGTASLRGRNAAGVADATVCHLAGQIGRRPRSATAIAAVVGEAFAVPARVLSFHGRWLRLGEAHRTRLGGRNSSVGEGLIGDRVWDVQSSCRLRLGPLDLARFGDFLPGGAAHTPLARLVRFLVGLALEVELQLVLRRDEVPALRLGSGGARLGWTTWLTSRPLTHDPDDVVLAIGTEEAA